MFQLLARSFRTPVSFASMLQRSWSSPTLTLARTLSGIKNPKTKMKTHKGTQKRWSAIASGQYKRGRPGKRHLNVTLSSDRLNRLGRTAYATPAQVKVLKKLLPGQ